MNAAPEPGGDDEAIRAYVRAQVHSFTRDAIVSTLVAAGHDRARVEEIWEQEWTGAPHRPTHEALSRYALGLFLSGGVVGALGALPASSLVNTYAGGSGAVFLAIYAIGYVAIGLSLWKLVGWGAWRLRITGGWAFLVGLLLIPAYGALMFGGCFAAIGLANGVGG